MVIVHFDPMTREAADLLPLRRSYFCPARLPDHPDEQVAQDTITLPDICFALPDRSVKRRRVFHDLQNRYYYQVLHGCSNPRCETPTCLSCRKRVCKGEFHPPTALSACTLAVHLASNVPPGRGLCPHLSTVSEGSGLVGSSAKLTPTSETCEVSEYSKRTAQNSEAVADRVTQPDRSTANQTPRGVGVGEGVHRQSHIVHHETTDKKDKQKFDQSELDRKVRDTKSFTQCIFGTFSTKLSHFAKTSEEHNYRARPQGQKDNIRSRHESPTRSKTSNEESEDKIADRMRPGAASSGSELYLARGVEPSAPDGPSNEGHQSSNEHSDFAPNLPQTLSHFSDANIKGLVKMMTENHHDIFKEHQFLRSLGRLGLPTSSSKHSHVEAASYEGLLVFIAQSMTYVLGNAKGLLASFLDSTTDSQERRIVRPYDFTVLVSLFQDLKALDFHPSGILPNLWVSAGHMFPRAPNRERQPMTDGVIWHDNHEPLNNHEAIHISRIILSALIALVPQQNIPVLIEIIKSRASGRKAAIGDAFPGLVSGTEIAFENDLALCVMKRFLMAITARNAGDNPSMSPGRCESKECCFFTNLLPFLVGDEFQVHATGANPVSLSHGRLLSISRTKSTSTSHHALAVCIGWLQSLIINEWDGKPQVRRFSVVGAALEFLDRIHWHSGLQLGDSIFHLPLISDRLDLWKASADWASADDDKSMVSLLDYRFLFPLWGRVFLFRAINHARMDKARKEAKAVEQLTTRCTFAHADAHRGALKLTSPLLRAKKQFLVLDVRREDVLTDAMDQLWRRQKCELMQPLKIWLGSEEGEEGVDHGGVQQEFIRIAFTEAMDPKYGAFTTDEMANMSWFHPNSQEPLYKFELLGLLTSIAVYNGLSLPFSFPIAFYLNLLGIPCTEIAHIQDGWPDLAKGLQDLLNWPDDKVEEDFVREYVFTVPGFGIDENLDMSHTTRSDGCLASSSDQDSACSTSSEENGTTGSGTASSSSSESETGSSTKAVMVTNENREQYVRDYIYYLTQYTIRDQQSAFQKGFFTCITKKAISLFTPDELSNLIQGLPDIDIDRLKFLTGYGEGFDDDHPTIRHFWKVLRTWSQEQLRQLLKFVTASSRLPSVGVAGFAFVIQKNGVADEESLPSSATCARILLMPAYPSEDMLRRKLELAMGHSEGFGRS